MGSQFGPVTFNSGPSSLKTEDLHRSCIGPASVDRLLSPRDFEEITEVVRNDLKIVRGPEDLPAAAAGRLQVRHVKKSAF